jgi:mannosyltransferase
VTRAAGLLAVLTAAAAALRFATLDLQGLWYDEAVTAGLVGLDLPDLLERIPESESTPPLYYLLAWLWTGAFGDGEVGLRSLSALIGTLTVPTFYLAARELTGSERTGLVVAALAAFNPLLVWYSQEARSYALAVLLCGVSLACFGRLLQRQDGDGRWLAGWALSSALALATHYFAVFLVAPVAAWLLWHSERRGRVGVAVAAVALAGAALVPLAAHQASLDLASFIGSDSLLRRLAQVPKQFVLGFNAPLETLLAGAALMVLGAGAVVALVRRPSAGVRAAALVGGAAVAIPTVLALVDVDYLLTRNVIVAWLPLAVVAAAGLARSVPGLTGAAAVCALGLATVVGVALEPRWQRDDWRGAAAALGPPATVRATVLTPAETGTVPFRLYHPDARPFPPARAPVREIALVAPIGGDGRPPPRPSVAPVPGFPRVRRRLEDGYTVITLSGPRPVPVTPAQLAALRLSPDRNAAVLLEPGG